MSFAIWLIFFVISIAWQVNTSIWSSYIINHLEQTQVLCIVHMYNFIQMFCMLSILTQSFHMTNNLSQLLAGHTYNCSCLSSICQCSCCSLILLNYLIKKHKMNDVKKDKYWIQNLLYCWHKKKNTKCASCKASVFHFDGTPYFSSVLI